jgi:uncharacterized protein (TIGR02246 family)
MTRFALAAALALLAPAPCAAETYGSAHTALDGWSAAYTAADVEGVVQSYWPDATLFGTDGGNLATGADAIRKHYAELTGRRVQNRIGRRHPIPLGPNAVVISGYYEFIRLHDGKPVSAFARFTMLFTKRGNEWRIAHHHSSAYIEPKR